MQINTSSNQVLTFRDIQWDWVSLYQKSEIRKIDFLFYGIGNVKCHATCYTISITFGQSDAISIQIQNQETCVSVIQYFACYSDAIQNLRHLYLSIWIDCKSICMGLFFVHLFGGTPKNESEDVGSLLRTDGRTVRHGHMRKSKRHMQGDRRLRSTHKSE